MKENKNRKYECAVLLSKEQKADASALLKEYIANNFGMEIGNLQAGFFLDFITDKIGIYYYNQAVTDAISFISEKADDMYLLMKDEN